MSNDSYFRGWRHADFGWLPDSDDRDYRAGYERGEEAAREEREAERHAAEARREREAFEEEQYRAACEAEEMRRAEDAHYREMEEAEVTASVVATGDVPEGSPGVEQGRGAAGASERERGSVPVRAHNAKREGRR